MYFHSGISGHSYVSEGGVSNTNTRCRTAMNARRALLYSFANVVARTFNTVSKRHSSFPQISDAIYFYRAATARISNGARLRPLRFMLCWASGCAQAIILAAAGGNTDIASLGCKRVLQPQCLLRQMQLSCTVRRCRLRARFSLSKWAYINNCAQREKPAAKVLRASKPPLSIGLAIGRVSSCRS